MWQRRARKEFNRGKPRFEPTEEQRFMVSAMVSMRMTWEEMRLGIRNQATGEAISKTCFAKAFQRELKEGQARLKSLLTTKYYQHLAQGREWAIRAGLRNRFGWTFEGTPPAPVLEASDGIPAMQINFVLPSRKEGPPAPPIDVTPDPYAGQPADLSKPALPPPPERRRGPLGLWTEEKPKGTDWMK
jgi:hypothetical protein